MIYFLPIICNLFNKIYNDGQFPDQWCESIIVPIYKKGDHTSPGNYRGISLLNVLGKVYTSIINRRLTFFANIFDKIKEPQAGFREGYSTIDNAYILQGLIDKQLSKKGGKMFVAYVDFLKAFDLVSRPKLFEILSLNGVYGKLYKSLTAMYTKVRARVRSSNNSL